MTFDDAIARFATYLLTAGGRSRATVDGYSRDLEQFCELTGVGQLDALDRAAVLRWLNLLYEREYSARSIARKLSALRSFISWALEHGLLTADPVPPETSLPRTLYLPHAISEDEVAAMIGKASGDDTQSSRDHAILETLYATGMRVSELCGLTLTALQLAEGFATVSGKGGKQRLVPLGQCAINALKRYLDSARDELCPSAPRHGEVFLTRRGPISRSTVFRLVQKYARCPGSASEH